jgi:hypothetical protein
VRNLDASGAASWGQALASGTGRDVVARGVLTSSESTQTFVGATYGRFLFRPPDSGSAAAAAAALSTGTSTDTLNAIIVSSPEYLQARVTGPSPPNLLLPSAEILDT